MYFLSPMWIFLCFVTLFDLLNLWLQMSHSNGRFSLWLFLWHVSSFLGTHSLPHISHLCCLLMLWCSFMWESSLTPVTNCTSHRTLMCGCCICMCILWWSTISSVENNFLQNLHFCAYSLLKPGPLFCKSLLWSLPSLNKSFAALKDKRKKGYVFIWSRTGMYCYLRFYSNTI